MAENTTIARPYAEAAFEIARAGHALPAWSEALSFIATVMSDPQMKTALDDPQLETSDKEAMALSVAGDRLAPEVRNFLRVLIEGDRLAVLPEIAQMFDTLKDEAEGSAKATIESAFPMSDEQVDELKRALEKRFGKKIETSVAVNPELIGGARVTVGDSVIDGSVQAKLQAMATQLRA